MGALTPEQHRRFREEGLLVLRGHYDVEREILPIQRAIHRIIGLVIDRHGLDIDRAPFSPERFDDGYAALLALDRAYAGEVYDAAKQIPAFLRLICSARSEALFCELRGTDAPGVGRASYGIRIDNPGEERFRSHWHQEFIFQPQSMDGVTFWTPLAPVRAEMGPVSLCVGSHKDGLRTVSRRGAYGDKPGAYQVGIVDEAAVVSGYEQVAPLSEPGDLLLIDFLTIHQSGANSSDRARWTVQSRFFNFLEPTGMRVGWRASVTAGTDIDTVLGEHFETEDG